MNEVWGVRASLGFPRPKSYLVVTGISKEDAAAYVVKRKNKHFRAEVYIEKIFREAAEGLRQRTMSKNSNNTTSRR
jgi:hypothetical protein